MAAARIGARIRVGLFVLGPLAAVHTLLVWRVLRGPFNADHGRWLHEIERFAAGQVLYRDYTWPFPPMGLWLVGLPARLLSPNIGVINATTALIFFAITALFAVYVARLVEDRRTMLLACVAGFLSALWAAQLGSSPLPNGMYTPAAPIGAAFLFGAVLAWIPALRSRAAGWSLLAGILAGCAVLTKQDFWPPAAMLIGCGTTAAWLTRRIGRRAAFAAYAGAIVTVALGLLVVIASAGPGATIEMLMGHGHLVGAAHRGFPTASRLVIELIGLTGWGAAILLARALIERRRQFHRPALVLAVAATAACVSWIVISMFVARTALPDSGSMLREAFAYHIAAGHSLVQPAFGELRALLYLHVLPVSGSLVMAVLVLAWKPASRQEADRRFLFLALLAVCVASRARRQFEYVEWYHYLLEVPLFCAILVTAVRRTADQRSARTLALVLLAPLALFAIFRYHDEGIGALTVRSRVAAVSTPHGAIRLQPDSRHFLVAMRTAALDVDRSGTRPIFAYGKTGGVNYFLGRPNLTSSTHGFLLSGRAEELERELLASPQTILVDVPVYDGDRPRDNDLLSWDTYRSPSPYATFDRPIFDRLLERCHSMARMPVDSNRPFFVMYDCTPRDAIDP